MRQPRRTGCLAWAAACGIAACGPAAKGGAGWTAARTRCPASPGEHLGAGGEWRGHEAPAGPGVWTYAEVVRDTGAPGAHGYVALLRLPGTTDTPRGGGSRLPGERPPRASAAWFGALTDTLRYDADRRVLRVGARMVGVDTANVVLVDVGTDGRVAAVRAVGCVALTPGATAADRALAEVPAARAFAARQ